MTKEKKHNLYNELKKKHQKEINDFPIMFAFSNIQFEEGKQKLNVVDDSDLISIGAGGFIRKSDKDSFMDMLERQSKERKQAQKNEQYLYEMFFCEMADHEYCITDDLMDTLSACGVTVEDINNNESMCKALQKAEKDYLSSCIF